MKKIKFFLYIIFISSFLNSQELKNYDAFNKEGKKEKIFKEEK